MDQDAAGEATVVVSRLVRPGETRNFERWLHRLQRAVEQAPGHVATTVRPPDSDGSSEWVVLYRFRSAGDLDNWLCSAKRLALVEAGAAYLVDQPVEQRILHPGPDSVTLVSAVRLRHGTAERHRLLHERGVADARQMGGLIRAELIPACVNAQPDTVAVMTFRSRAQLDRWLESAERRAVLDDMAELLDRPRTINIVGGYAGWFAGSGTGGPKRWKQAVAVVAGLIPVSLAVTVVREAVLPAAPTLAVVVINAVVNVVLLTWVVMPVLTRALRSWLAR